MLNFVTEEEVIDLGGDLDLGQDEENGAMNKSIFYYNQVLLLRYEVLDN